MNVTHFNVVPHYVTAKTSNVAPFMCTTWYNIRHVYFQKNAFATVASVFMPALAPKGNVLFEEGGYYIDGDN